MASDGTSPPASTAYKAEPQQLAPEDVTFSVPARKDPNFAFTTAAFAFRDALDRSKNKKAQTPAVSVREVKQVKQDAPDIPPEDPVLEQAKMHLRRHKKNFQMARAIQHLLSSGLSLVIAGLQIKVCRDSMASKISLTKLLPAIMLLTTAVAAIVFDVFALIAYFAPQSKFGRTAYDLALKSHYIITTFKSVAYVYSTAACYSTTLSGLPMKISMYISPINVAIEVIGLVIDQYVQRDAERAKELGITDAAIADADTASAGVNSSSNTQPLLPTYSFRHGPYQKLEDSDFDQLDSLGSGLSADVEKSTPSIPKPSV